MTYVTKYILFYSLFCAILIIVNEGLTRADPPHRGQGRIAMSKYFSDYGRLAPLSREAYFAGDWEYVCSSVASDDDVEYDIVRSYDNSDWRYTSI